MGDFEKSLGGLPERLFVKPLKINVQLQYPGGRKGCSGDDGA